MIGATGGMKGFLAQGMTGPVLPGAGLAVLGTTGGPSSRRRPGWLPWILPRPRRVEFLGPGPGGGGWTTFCVTWLPPLVWWTTWTYSAL